MRINKYLVHCDDVMSYANLVYAPAITICIMISTVLYIRIYQIARRHQLLIHIQQQTVQTATVEHNLNIARCKKSALNTIKYYICMILCYFPVFTVLILLTINPRLQRQDWNRTIYVMYMNSSINPILYCWRVRKLQNAVLGMMGQLLCKQAEEN